MAAEFAKGWETASAEQLAQIIEQQKNVCRALLSDIEAPHNIQRDAAQALKQAEELPAEIDKQIVQLEAQLKQLRDNRESRILNAAKRAGELTYRRDNTQAMYADACDLRDAMHRRMKLLDNDGKLSRAREMQKQIEAFRAKLPPEMQQLTLDELAEYLKSETAGE